MTKSRIGAAIVFCVLLAACGGGGTTADAPSANAAAMAALATPAQPIPSSTTGSVYERLDNVAYAPEFAPQTGIADTLVTLAAQSTLTTATGQFNVPSSTIPTRNQSPLAVTAFGYQSTTYPWTPSDAQQALPLGIFAGVAGTPRPGFVGGAVLHDQGGWLQNTYNDGMFTPTIDRIKKSMGGNIVAFSDQAWVTAWNPQVPSVTIANHDLFDQIPMAPLAMYQTMVQDAKARNMQFMMMLGIFGDGRVAPEIWRWSQVPASNTVFWDKVFSDYQAVVLERTAIARDLGIEYISLGIDLWPMWKLGPSRWQPLIAAMRGIGYTGKITMFLPMDMVGYVNPYVVQSFGDGSKNRIAMMGLFDAIGIIFNAGALRTNFETLAPAQTRARLRSSVSQILGELSDAPVPVHVMVTTPSVFGGVVDPAYIEPCALPDCNSLALTSTRDYQQQADMYQAVAEAINATPTGNGRVMGLISWGYHYRDDPTWGLNPGDSAYDMAASIRGKPAEAVVKYWLQRWTPSERVRVFNWAESAYAQFFPGPATSSGYLAPYTYRYYGATGNYLAEANGRTVVHNGHNWILQDVGAVTDFVPLAGAAGF